MLKILLQIPKYVHTFVVLIGAANLQWSSQKSVRDIEYGKPSDARVVRISREGAHAIWGLIPFKQTAHQPVIACLLREATRNGSTIRKTEVGWM